MYVLLDYSVTIYFLFRPTSDFPHPLAHVKHQMGYRVSSNDGSHLTSGAIFLIHVNIWSFGSYHIT